MASTPNPKKVVTGKVRLSYCHLTEPYAQSAKDDPKYSTVIIIPKSDKATLRAIKAAQKIAAEEGVASKWGGRNPKNLHYTLKDGDVDADLERNPEYEGCYYMSVSSGTQRPGLVDRKLEPITDASEVYSGVYARVSMTAFPYDWQGNKGVSFGLNHVQKIADGEPFGGRTRAEDDFEELDEDEYDEEDDDLL